MENVRLFNKLMLSSCPVSNFDFSYLKTELAFQELVSESNIYMVVQRPTLYFHHLYVDPNSKDDIMHFEIRQKGNDAVLKCKFPFRQNALKSLGEGKMNFHFTIDYEFLHVLQEMPPFNYITTLLLQTNGSEYGSWFTPEKLLYDFWNDLLEIEIDGDIEPFLKYKVHYIGKATEEHILKRLTGHERLQDILSIEMPLQYGALPTDEIAILFFEFSDNIHVAMLGHGEMTEELFEQMMSVNLPALPQKELYHDAEKALIHAFTPKHNKVLYKSYPKGTQSLQKHELKVFTYSFLDPVTLVFNDKEIKGSQDFFNVDMLLVKKGEPLVILKSS